MKSPLLRAAAIGAAISLFPTGLVGFTLAASADDFVDPAVVASGLNNPRQLSLTSDGVLLVAEAGRGGKACVGPETNRTCIGATGAVSAFFRPLESLNAHPVRVVTGLLSGSGPDGSFAIGSDGVSARRFLGGENIYVQQTASPPELPDGIPPEQSGKLLSARPGEDFTVVADITAYEQEHDPDGHGFESNPYAVLDMGDHRLVADAAANAVFRVAQDGTVSLFHVFHNLTTPECTTPNPATGWKGYSPAPEFPGCNFVPTSLALGPDSDIYVGGLSSEVANQGQVLRLDHASGEPKRIYTGFTTITGVALDNAGSLYVSQLFAPPLGPDAPIPGRITQVTQEGRRTDKAVPFPAGLAIDQNRNVFVSAYSVASEEGMGGPAGGDTSGQIWRLRF